MTETERPVGEAPRTEAGKALYRVLSAEWGKPNARIVREQVVAIEREAAQEAIGRMGPKIRRDEKAKAAAAPPEPLRPDPNDMADPFARGYNLGLHHGLSRVAEVEADASALPLDVLKRALLAEFKTPHYGYSQEEAITRAIFLAPRLLARLSPSSGESSERLFMEHEYMDTGHRGICDVCDIRHPYGPDPGSAESSELVPEWELDPLTGRPSWDTET